MNERKKRGKKQNKLQYQGGKQKKCSNNNKRKGNVFINTSQLYNVKHCIAMLFCSSDKNQLHKSANYTPNAVSLKYCVHIIIANDIETNRNLVQQK